jgi:predicted esterase
MLHAGTRRAAVIVLLAISAMTASAADSPRLPAEAMVVAPVGTGGGRSAVHRDPLEAQIVAGKWTPPRAGDKVLLPDGSGRTWETLKAGDDGTFRHASLNGGYAYLAVPADRDQVMILEASSDALVYVNGEPRAGDFYQHGYVHLPVLLRQGTNDFLFQCVRGQLAAKLVEPKAAAQLHTGDMTLPTLPVDGKEPLWAAIVVINATAEPLTGLHLQARLGDEKPAETPLPAVPGVSIRKVPFRVPPAGSRQEGDVECHLQLVRRTGGNDKGESLDAATIKLQVRRPDQLQVRTFRSDIDGSVQYYALVPARAGAGENPPKPGLVLTLHGAAVQADGQAACYKARPWAHVVAPTNRRPYGFDWEDWGRLDALEVLEVARKDLGTDPRRTWLTGHSMGGHGTWFLGATYPDRFAAIAPSAGWISMWSYAGARRPENPDAIQEMFLRAASPSDTLALARNYAHEGVYVLHGDKDDNVPVAQSRQMKEVLSGFHKDFVYHEQPGAGHWWGNECVDWPALMDFLDKHTLPQRGEVRDVEFVTASPGVSAWCDWAGIEAQVHPLKPSRIQLHWDADQQCVSGTTDNVSRLAIDVNQLDPGKRMPESISVELDGQKVDKIAWQTTTRRVWLQRDGDRWVATTPAPGTKGPERYGPFKDAFRNRMLFVYGTKGTAEENAWARAKARYDAEAFWYRGNGSLDVLPDTAFDADAERDRNVILYGNADSNGAWQALLAGSPVQVRRGVVTVGEHAEKGDDLACLFLRPRPGSEVAGVGVVSGTGPEGMRLTDRLPYFVSGVGYPDCVVLGTDVLTQGYAGVRGAGFFGVDWSVTKGEFAWRK